MHLAPFEVTLVPRALHTHTPTPTHTHLPPSPTRVMKKRMRDLTTHPGPPDAGTPQPEADVPRQGGCTFIEDCSRAGCEHTRNEAVHWHCVDEACPSRGVVGTLLPFVTNDTRTRDRHILYHATHARKETAQLLELYRHVHHTCGGVAPPAVTDRVPKISQFRKEISLQPAQEGTSASWATRLYVGKAGPTATSLAGAIEAFGVSTVRRVGTLRTEAPLPYTEAPLPGHTIEFFPHSADAEDVWFAVCCSGVSIREVGGDSGPAVLVRWFDREYTDVWEGGPVTIYDLTKTTEYQLVAAMSEWGSLLQYDAERKIFVLLGYNHPLHLAGALPPPTT